MIAGSGIGGPSARTMPLEARPKGRRSRPLAGARRGGGAGHWLEPEGETEPATGRSIGVALTGIIKGLIRADALRAGIEMHLLMFILFALIPIVLAVAPVPMIEDMIAASKLAPMFDSQLILSILHGSI